MVEMSEIIMDADANAKATGLEQMQKEALLCLDSFPNKVVELNNMIDSYIPSSAKSKGYSSQIRKVQRSGLTIPTVRNFDGRVSSLETDASSICSLFDSNLKMTGFKKRYYRGGKRYGLRRNPGPLGTLLTFIASNIAKCTKQLLIMPSWYILEKVYSLLILGILRKNVKNAKLESSIQWQTPSIFPTTLNEDNSAISNFINVIRPATVQLIEDIRIIKKWLQALSVKLSPDLAPSLVKAIRTIETIDCWVYELFFKLKTCQMNQRKKVAKAAEIGLKMNEDIEYLKLWHRTIELRNNYIILYNILRHDENLQETLADQI